MEKQDHPLKQFLFCPKCGSREFVIHDGKSRHCNACGFTYYFNPSAATVAVIVNEHHELLVCRRGKEPACGTLDLPGGFCDCFETAEEGVAREVKEETGLQVCETHYLFSLPNLYLYSGFLVHTMDLFFLCTVSGDNTLKAMDDVADSFWLPLEQIRPEDFGLQSVRQGIQRIIDGNLPDRFLEIKIKK